MVNLLIDIVDTLVTKTTKTENECVYKELELNMHVNKSINILCGPRKRSDKKGHFQAFFRGSFEGQNDVGANWKLVQKIQRAILHRIEWKPKIQFLGYIQSLFHSIHYTQLIKH